MELKYIVDHIPKNTPKRRPGYPMTPKYLTVHSTGNPKSTARNERDWLTNPSNTGEASYHIVVDEKEAIECIPLSENAWHAGDGGNGIGNRYSIGIEICESGDREKTLRNAVILIAKILKDYGWNVDRIRQHNHWSGKNCPRILREGNLWEKFISDVEKELERLSGSQKKELYNVFNYHPNTEVIEISRRALKDLRERGIVSEEEEVKFGEEIELAKTIPAYLLWVFLARIIEK